MTLEEFDRAVEGAMAAGDLTTVERLLRTAEENAAAAQIRCKEHPRYRGIRQPRGTCSVCWKIWGATNGDDE